MTNEQHTTPRTTAECYADELDRQAGDYGPCDPGEYPHEAYAWTALRAGAAALRAPQGWQQDVDALKAEIAELRGKITEREQC